ncbi:MAG: hypothetical protein ACAH83_11800 [Alphaproteobacteria bacterium]
MENQTASLARNPAEKVLRDLDCAFERKPDGTLMVTGHLDLTDLKLQKLPDLSWVMIAGDFNCSGNALTDLELAPRSVGGGFYCHRNRLTSLKGAPDKVGGNFHCHNNQLTSLEHAPAVVGADFTCSKNQLTNLEHAPRLIGGNFYCHDNLLRNLAHVPRKFKKLQTDFGEFSVWSDIPANLLKAI